MGASANASAARSAGLRGGSGAMNFGPALRGSSGEASLATLGCSSSATACGLTGGTGAGVDSGALA